MSTKKNLVGALRLYHIVSREDWQKCQVDGFYRPLSLEKEGFIHLSSREQVLGSANLFFRGRRGLLLLEIEILPTDPHLRWESAAGPGKRQDQFPHYYASLKVTSVKVIHEFEPGGDGNFVRIGE